MIQANRTERLITYGVMLAYAVVLATMTVLHLRYSLGPFNVHFNSDSAANVLYAHEIIAQRTLFPQWNDATGVMSVLTAPNLLLTSVLLTFVHDWPTASRIGIALDQLIMFGLLFWTLGRMRMSSAGRLLLITILMVGPALSFLLQTTLLAGKSWSFTWLLLFIYLVGSLLERETAATRWRAIALVLVGGLVFTDVANAATILPAIGAALVAEWLGDTGADVRRRCGSAVLFLLAGCALGQIVRYTLLAGNHYAQFSVPFTDLGVAGAHLDLFVRGMLSQFGAVPHAGVSPYSITGAASGVKFLVLIIAMTLPLSLALRRNVLNNRYARMLAVACATSFVIRLYIYLFTDISVGIEGTARYFITEILIGITLAIFYLEQRISERWLRELLLLAACVPFVVTSPLLAGGTAGITKNQRLARALADAGLKHGYASFWNANVITAVSNGDVAVRQVEFHAGSIAPMRWLSANRWYRGDPKPTESFLLLDPEEASHTDLATLDQMAGAPSRRLNIADYVVQIYPFDLGLRLDWEHPLDQPLDASAMRARIEPVSTEVDNTRRVLIMKWRIRNLGEKTFSSFGNAPVNLGLHLRDAAGEIQTFDLLHAPIPSLLPNAEIETSVDVPLSSLAGGKTIEADLLQEGVAWFADRGGQTARIPVPEPEKTSGHIDSHIVPTGATPMPSKRTDRSSSKLPRAAGSRRHR